MEILGFRYVEIKGGMKQTHRRTAFKSEYGLKIGTVVDFECSYECDHLKWFVQNDTNIEDEKEFYLEADKVENSFYFQTTVSYKGTHKLTAIAYDKDENEIARSEAFLLNSI